MKTEVLTDKSRFLPAAVLVTALAVAGCHRHEGDAAAHRHEEEHSHHHGHDPEGDHSEHGVEDASGVARFDARRGVLLTEEIQRNIQLQTATAELRAMPVELRFTLQIFGEQHRHPLAENDHSGCDLHGSGLLPVEAAKLVRAGQRVEVPGSNAAVSGVVLGVHQALARGELEVVAGLSNAAPVLRPGEFLPARIRIPRDRAVVAVPQPALLRIAEGNFVYVQTGDAFLRRAVTPGTASGGWIEIADGLRAEERVVTHPVQTLWLVELRATRGGGHSH